VPFLLDKHSFILIYTPVLNKNTVNTCELSAYVFSNQVLTVEVKFDGIQFVLDKFIELTLVVIDHMRYAFSVLFWHKKPATYELHALLASFRISIVCYVGNVAYKMRSLRGM